MSHLAKNDIDNNEQVGPGNILALRALRVNAAGDAIEGYVPPAGNGLAATMDLGSQVNAPGSFQDSVSGNTSIKVNERELFNGSGTAPSLRWEQKEILGDWYYLDGNSTFGAGKVLTSDAAGKMTWQTPAAGGNETLAQTMDLGQNVNADGIIKTNGGDSSVDVNSFGLSSPKSGGNNVYWDADTYSDNAGTFYGISTEGILGEDGKRSINSNERIMWAVADNGFGNETFASVDWGNRALVGPTQNGGLDWNQVDSVNTRSYIIQSLPNVIPQDNQLQVGDNAVSNLCFWVDEITNTLKVKILYADGFTFVNGDVASLS